MARGSPVGGRAVPALVELRNCARAVDEDDDLPVEVWRERILGEVGGADRVGTRSGDCGRELACGADRAGELRQARGGLHERRGAVRERRARSSPRCSAVKSTIAPSTAERSPQRCTCPERPQRTSPGCKG
ncbi:hypothetical protein CNX65_19645 [Actinosynnema pretiosum]|uniref:Uncharacterized protein n=1 Tax=Actinosynnema pretiosum TaxID=42197 RepID=A0A290Z8D4_9PSEU|nr:hypothetical protein CNX65_19645 [Actinosynnema pretiosum]